MSPLARCVVAGIIGAIMTHAEPTRAETDNGRLIDGRDNRARAVTTAAPGRIIQRDLDGMRMTAAIFPTIPGHPAVIIGEIEILGIQSVRFQSYEGGTVIVSLCIAPFTVTVAISFPDPTLDATAVVFTRL
jgi:hypothetical protein